MARGVGDPGRVLEINRAYEQQARTVRNLTQQYRAANREAVSTSRTFGTLNADVTRLGGSFATMADRILPNWRIVFTASVAGAAVALAKLTTSAARALDDLDDMASATGTTTQQIEKLQLAAAKAGDQGFESINKALERTTKAMGLAAIEREKLNSAMVVSATGVKQDFSDPFKAVLLDPADFKDSLALLEAWAARVERIRNPAIQAAIASDLLGKSWARVLPTLKNLRAEMEQAERDIAAGGGFTSQQAIEAAGKFQAALAKLEALFYRVRNAAGAALGAALTPAIDQLTAYVQQNMQEIGRWIVNAATYLKALTQDLIRFFVLGLPGQQTEWGAAIIKTLIYLQNDLIPGLVTAFNGVMAVLDQVAGAINAVFGTNLTGGQVGLAIVIAQVSGALTVMAAALGAVGTVLSVGSAIALALTPAGWLVAGMVALSAAIVTLTGQWGALADAIVSAGREIAGGMQVAWDWLKSVGAAVGNISIPGAAAAPATPMASGGMVPGSGNRDSFPAWLMPGEFVIRKSIVSALGADFFAGLNRGMGSLLPRSSFATGGLVMAEPAGGGTPVHLHIGGGSFPLNGAPAVVSALVVEAHRQHIRSAGIKPSWYGGR